MSAECWMFEVDTSLPFFFEKYQRYITIYVRYIGPNWEDYYDSPTTKLRSIKEHLEIYQICGLEKWCDEDFGIKDFYESLQAWLNERQDQLMDLIIHSFERDDTKPRWYWDT